MRAFAWMLAVLGLSLVVVGCPSESDEGVPIPVPDAQDVVQVQDAPAVEDPGAAPEDAPAPQDLPPAADLPAVEDAGPKPVCDPKPPLEPFVVEVLGADSSGAQWVFSGKALVAYAASVVGGSLVDAEVRFRLLSSGQEATVRTALPSGYRIPVQSGETVFVVVRHGGASYTNDAIAVWGADDELRFFLYSGDMTEPTVLAECGDLPCPTIGFGEAVCAPEQDPCGLVSVPPAKFGGAWGVNAIEVPQGESHSDGHEKFFTVRTWTTEQPDGCDDTIPSWVSAFYFDASKVSQCACHDPSDCAATEVCEPEAKRCVPNQCLAAPACPGGQVCNPYTGACDAEPSAELTCETTEDCPVGGVCFYVCNPYTHACQMSDCCLVDCLGSCSTLLETCYQCLSDCDCDTGQCDPESKTCDECKTDKISFTKENTPKYEFYELCIPKGLEGPLGAMKAIDPSITCGVAGVFAKCDKATEDGCHGDLEYELGSKVLTDTKWAQLCALSKLHYVSKIGGGHFVD